MLRVSNREKPIKVTNYKSIIGALLFASTKTMTKYFICY